MKNKISEMRVDDKSLVRVLTMSQKYIILVFCQELGPRNQIRK